MEGAMCKKLSVERGRNTKLMFCKRKKFNSGLATLFWEEGMEEIWTGVNGPMNNDRACPNHFLQVILSTANIPGMLESLVHWDK